jgi:hypothetical protein
LVDIVLASEQEVTLQGIYLIVTVGSEVQFSDARMLPDDCSPCVRREAFSTFCEVISSKRVFALLSPE